MRRNRYPHSLIFRAHRKCRPAIHGTCVCRSAFQLLDLCSAVPWRAYVQNRENKPTCDSEVQNPVVDYISICPPHDVIQTVSFFAVSETRLGRRDTDSLSSRDC
uniref:Uncharacterized protein n=1 Tax=Steinernema glaseri TaxID=37863 RepID=A0A1I7Y7U4_9BILA